MISLRIAIVLLASAIGLTSGPAWAERPLTGIASWYGPHFHLRPTALGEIFDRNGLTAASRSLPLPSIVRVTNLDNGRSVVLRVNDRGPYRSGRIIDVSEHAAQLLGFHRQGLAQVRIDVLPAATHRAAMIRLAKR